MSALAVLAVLSLGLVPGGDADPVSADPVPAGLPGLDAGPVTVEGGAIAVDSAAPALPLPLPAVGTEVGLPLLPGLSVEVAPAATAGQGGATAPAAQKDGPLGLVEDAPPAAVAAGSSVLATLLGYALWLGAKGTFGLFSRIEDDALATHPLRRQALDFIASNPGACLQDVRRSLGIAWGTAVYHLGRLERAGLIAVRHVEGRRGHWPLGQAPSRDALPPTAKALADLVLGRPGLSQGELAVLAGIGAPAACKQLARLESAGLVTAVRTGRSRLYRSTGRLDALLAPASA